jgi:heptose I phosphotransferase
MLTGVWRRLVRGEHRLHQQHDWEHFAGADWADRVMSVLVTDHFHAKQGRSIARWTLAAGGDRLVVYLKRHHRLPRWRGLLAALCPTMSWSPALQEWDHLEWARKEGLPVPRAVAAGQFLAPGGRLQSFLAVEELAGMLPLHEAVPLASRRLSPADFAAWKRGLVAEMARLARALHDRRHFHKDFYFCHFYIAEADTLRPPASWQGRVSLIDLHRLTRHRWTWPWWQAKDLGQLLYSSEVAGVTARDRLRFWHLYRAGQKGGAVFRWLRWLVTTRARNYRGHSRRKPQVPQASPAPHALGV